MINKVNIGWVIVISALEVIKQDESSFSEKFQNQTGVMGGFDIKSHDYREPLLDQFLLETYFQQLLNTTFNITTLSDVVDAVSIDVYLY